jgi:hypothetical protein
VSFQRYALPDEPSFDAAPSSLGALPVGFSGHELLLPLAQRECFWIGLSKDTPQPLSLTVALERDDGTRIDVLSGKAWSERSATMADLARTPRIDGIRRADGRFDPLQRDDGEGLAPRGCCLRLLVCDARDRVTEQAAVIKLVDYATFTERTGLPPPEAIDPDAGYKGWLLP